MTDSLELQRLYFTCRTNRRNTRLISQILLGLPVQEVLFRSSINFPTKPGTISNIKAMPRDLLAQYKTGEIFNALVAIKHQAETMRLKGNFGEVNLTCATNNTPRISFSLGLPSASKRHFNVSGLTSGQHVNTIMFSHGGRYEIFGSSFSSKSRLTLTEFYDWADKKVPDSFQAEYQNLIGVCIALATDMKKIDRWWKIFANLHTNTLKGEK